MTNWDQDLDAFYRQSALDDGDTNYLQNEEFVAEHSLIRGPFNDEIIFSKLIEQVDVAPIMAEVDRNWNLWNDIRAMSIPVQRHTLSIPLVARSGGNNSQWIRFYPGVPTAFPHTWAWLNECAGKLGGILQLATIVKLLPQSRVYEHHDRGLYYLIRDRYHLVLSSDRSEMCWGFGPDIEEQIWHTGELHWFNNKQNHWSRNPTDKDRIHLIFDVLPHSCIALRNELIKYE